MDVDLSGRGPSARRLGAAGLATLCLLGLLLYLLAQRYSGRFEDRVEVSALLTSTGDGLPERADVKFRGMVVGAVADVEIAARGERQRAHLELAPDAAATVPANVTARVIPNNIFGVDAIELVDTTPTEARLRAGAEIAEDTSRPTVALQTTLNVLRTVLANIQPERLGRVLATLSAALDPAARAPGSTIERLDTWLTAMHDMPGIGGLLGDLGRSATALSESAPDLVGVLANSVTTARTVVERRTQLVDVLTGSAGTVDAVNGLFARNPDAGKELVVGLDQLFGGLAKDPQAIPDTAANLNRSLQRFATTLHFGPDHQMVWSMNVSFTPFQQYTARDCPHYGTMSGPRCGGPGVPAAPPAQYFPAQLIPRWLDTAGPMPLVLAIPVAPTVPTVPGLPAIPGLPGGGP